MNGQSELRFAWWNVQNFAHHDPTKPIGGRWPRSQEEFDAKCRAIESAFDSIFGNSLPDLIGLCEITEMAAQELQRRKFTGYHLLHLGSPAGAEFQIAILYRESLQLLPLLPVSGVDVPRTTRDMPVVEFRTGTFRIRFIFCHWTAFGDSAKTYRRKLADAVRTFAFDSLYTVNDSTPTHIIVIGDLNSEPFDELFLENLHAHRDRDASTGRLYWQDEDVRRPRLYNCSWRHLGERRPHDPTGEAVHSAGTYFGKDGWRTYDQLLVSGGLLSDTPPYLDESNVEIHALSEVLGERGKPAKFEYKDGKASGLSDHLPLIGRIVLK